MELDTEFDFADIVDALDPNNPINNQPLSLNIGVDTPSSHPPNHPSSCNTNPHSIPVSSHTLNNTQTTTNHHHHNHPLHHNHTNHHQQISSSSNHPHSISSSQSYSRVKTKPKPKKPKIKTIQKSSFITNNSSREDSLDSSSTPSSNTSNIHNKQLFSYNTKNNSYSPSKTAPTERDLSATNELLNKLKKQKQDKCVELNSLMLYKSNNNIFGFHRTDEATLKCPWCGDSKGYRYITKHLYLKCNLRQSNMNQCGLLSNTRVLRSTRKDIDYKQYMNDDDDDDEDEETEDEEEEDDDDDDDDAEIEILDNDDDETTEDDYTMNRYEKTKNTKRYNRNIRQRRNHSRHQSDDDDDYAPQRRTKRKR